MKELQIKKNESGQRLDKFLKKYFKNAPGSFIYKMLRKKNITLNGSKADGSEILAEKDILKFFLSDETIDKFHEETVKVTSYKTQNMIKPVILYEDDDILLADKPVGVLSQKAQPQDISMNEIIIDYLIAGNKLSVEELSTFKPSVCNRLDRNTSGIITFGKSLLGLQQLSEGLKERTIDKYYLCVVSGVITEKSRIEGFLKKDEKTNKVTILKTADSKACEKICTEYLPVCNNGSFTLLKIKLHTGKTHQIRAHLSSVGHALAGDYKYGSARINDRFKEKYGIQSQLLHAFELYIPAKDLHVFAPVPELMLTFLKGEHLWEPGSQEALEALH